MLRFLPGRWLHLCRAANLLDLDFQAVPFPSVAAWVEDGRPRIEAEGVSLTDPDGILVRMMPPGSLEQVVFRMDALHRVAAAGVPVRYAATSMTLTPGSSTGNAAEHSKPAADGADAHDTE